jgi:hypothetical protein
MPSNMSFSHTTEQIINRTKTVTRRLGWRKLRQGQRVWAVEKTMGLRKGEKVKRLALLEIMSNRREALLDVTAEDVASEGFPGMSREDFIGLFLRINPTMTRFQRVSRIEFRYVNTNVKE